MRKRSKTGMAAMVMLLALSLPVSAGAAAPALTKEETFTVTEKSQKAYEKQISFPSEIKEDGTTYQLQDVKYKVLKETYQDLTRKEKDTTEEPKDTIEEDGQVFQLIRSEQEEKVEQEQAVTAYTDYEYAVDQAQVPKTKKATVQNDQTGGTEEVECQLTGVAQNGTKTVQGTMDLTFEEYDAAYYEWNGNYIKRNDQKPALEGLEQQLLDSVGSEGRITNISWNGDPYQDGNGTWCRNATAQVERKVPIYRATYAGVYQQKVTVYHCTYEGPDVTGKKTYEIQATAGYEEKKGSILPVVLAGVGILIGVIALILILYLLSRKKKEEKGTEEKTWNS